MLGSKGSKLQMHRADYKPCSANSTQEECPLKSVKSRWLKSGVAGESAPSLHVPHSVLLSIKLSPFLESIGLGTGKQKKGLRFNIVTVNMHLMHILGIYLHFHKKVHF